MVNPIDALIIVLAFASIALIIRNLIVSRDLKLPIRIKGSSTLKVTIGGSSFSGYIIVADKAPAGGREAAARLIEVAKSMRSSVTFISSMFKVEGGKLLGFIEEEIKKAELAYAATKHVRYAERLKLLQDLYRTVSRDHRPYLGSLALILWVPDDEESHEKIVEAFKSIAEAETGASFKILTGKVDLSSAITSVPSIESSLNIPAVTVGEEDLADGRGVVLGRLSEREGVLILDWPRDFEAHMGVFGPTGRGKTVLLAGLAAQLGILSESALNPYMVLVVDPKGDLASMLSGVASKIVRFKGGCIPMPRLDGLASELIKSSSETGWGRSRVEPCLGSLIERGLIVYDLSELPNEDRNVAASLIVSSLVIEASEIGLPGRMALIVDEAWRAAQGRATHMVIALREGRSRGLHIVYATQSPIDVPGAVLDNTRAILAFGGFTRNYVELAGRLGLENADILLKLPVGETLIKLGDRPPVRVYSYNYKSMLVKQLISGGGGDVSSGENDRGDGEKR